MINLLSILLLFISSLYSIDIEELLSSKSRENTINVNESQIPNSDLKENLFFLDETIDPKIYKDGPGDTFSFNLEIFLAKSFPLSPIYSNSKFLLKFNIRDGVLNHTY